MQIYDSSKKEKIKFIPQKENHVSLYVCGPTVYDDAHLGHARSAVAFDLLYRVLNANGYEVTYVRNITDIDDKIIKKSKETNKDIKEITSFYTSRYHSDMSRLNVYPPTIEPKATSSIDAMTDMIQKLLDKDTAYQTSNGDIYFDISKDEKYLSISHKFQNEEEKQQRVESVEEKRNSGDFALWKNAKDDEIGFDSPFGRGRPGWHLECSAMIEEYLDSKEKEFCVDIHGGGADLLFPHHENEAAQTRCAINKEIAKYWMHNGFVNINGEKMSKSLGNSFFLKDALKEYDGEVLRFYLLTTHYRSNLNFNTQDLESSKKRLDKLYRLKKRIFGIEADIKTDFQTKLLQALNDDLNTSKALSLIDEFVSSSNETLDTPGKHKNLKKEISSNINYIEKVLGFGGKNPYEYFQSGIDEETKQKIQNLIKQRDTAKKEKNFELADKIRDEILSFGVSLMDTPQGTFWEKA